MSRHQHISAPGGTYFFTVRLEDRGAKTLTNGIDMLRDAYASVLDNYPITCHAMVVLPDHIHAVWTVPYPDDEISLAWKGMEALFCSHLPAKPGRRDSKWRKGQTGTWQCKFWKHAIRSEADFQRHVDYCHFDPVKHGLVRRPEDWAVSTVHRAPMSEMILA
ncbi:REP-associated tyrosine transposase [Roseovarius arcticus]|uniref:REP-associated tyrosine transposase n=1 Tax=Roseovarius arcticus TaxID=2547404 RepID=UPI00111007CD|nr:transposase [Roseovarius arcticus]